MLTADYRFDDHWLTARRKQILNRLNEYNVAIKTLDADAQEFTSLRIYVPLNLLPMAYFNIAYLLAELFNPGTVSPIEHVDNNPMSMKFALTNSWLESDREPTA